MAANQTSPTPLEPHQITNHWRPGHAVDPPTMLRIESHVPKAEAVTPKQIRHQLVSLSIRESSLLKRQRWHVAGITKASSPQHSDPIKEMKSPKPGTDAATKATEHTMAARIQRKTQL
mmetsp:Transcript_15711/g.43955  ORF Transcript_15711/g.43955 Transcript_15711/m.43955 type:complete len:118 (-) Transcript_15711:1414-1767(-)